MNVFYPLDVYAIVFDRFLFQIQIICPTLQTSMRPRVCLIFLFWRQYRVPISCKYLFFVIFLLSRRFAFSIRCGI